jgi:hypothetical protein
MTRESGEEGEEGEEPAAIAADGDGRRPRRHMAKDDFRKEEDERRKRATECHDKSHRGRMHRGLNLAFVVFDVALVFSGITRSAVAVFNLITRQRGTPGQKAHQRVIGQCAWRRDAVGRKGRDSASTSTIHQQHRRPSSCHEGVAGRRAASIGQPQ